jgi:hypothetical protein
LKRKKKKASSLFTVDSTVQSTMKGIKRKKKKLKASTFSLWTAYNIKI